jgi:hypothetical protein
MALTVTDSGTTAALTSSPTVLATKTTGKTWVLALDLNNMAAGDVITLEVLVKTLTGSTERLLWSASWAHSQSGSPNVQTPPVPAPYSAKFQIKQPTGTGRTVDWALMSID